MTCRARAFAALLFLVSMSGILVSSAEEEVVLETSKDLYIVGDTVLMTLTNGSDSTLTLSALPPYEIWDADTEDPIWIGGVPQVAFIPPHQSADYEWDQTSSATHDQVAAGKYYAKVSYWLGGQESGIYGVVADTFLIRYDTPVGERSWGELKALWR